MPRREIESSAPCCASGRAGASSDGRPRGSSSAEGEPVPRFGLAGPEARCTFESVAVASLIPRVLHRHQGVQALGVQRQAHQVPLAPHFRQPPQLKRRNPSTCLIQPGSLRQPLGSAYAARAPASTASRPCDSSRDTSPGSRDLAAFPFGPRIDPSRDCISRSARSRSAVAGVRQHRLRLLAAVAASTSAAPADLPWYARVRRHLRRHHQLERTIDRVPARCSTAGTRVSSSSDPALRVRDSCSACASGSPYDRLYARPSGSGLGPAADRGHRPLQRCCASNRDFAALIVRQTVFPARTRGNSSPRTSCPQPRVLGRVGREQPPPAAPQSGPAAAAPPWRIRP